MSQTGWQAISLALLCEAGDRVEEALLRSGHPGSVYCSGLAWQLAAWDSQDPARKAAVFRHKEAGAWFVGARGPLLGFQDALQPLEVDWSFGFSLIDPDPDIPARVDRLMDLLSDEDAVPSLIWLGGVPGRGPFLRTLQARCRNRFKVLTVPGTDCVELDLEEGVEAWRKRRTAKFRANIKRIDRLNTEAGHRFEWHARGEPVEDTGRLLDLIEDIEHRSWKGDDPGENIFRQKRFRSFYISLFRKTAENGNLRLALVRNREDEAVAYAIGGRLGRYFRGFQMSFDKACRSTGPGNWIQARMLDPLAQEGVTIYDLGMALPYKKRWADREVPLVNLMLLRLS
ncbi:MAG: GNAT family N-acetyltransferase [Opitutales bacterium]